MPDIFTRYYVDGTLAREERRTLLLKSIRKGPVLQSSLVEFFIPIPRFSLGVEKIYKNLKELQY
jgi:hypothetical protein